MVKEPRPGLVKSRLARDIGKIPAAWWFRHQAGDLISRLSVDRRWETVLSVSPYIEGLSSRCWNPLLTRIPQGPGNIGDRMMRILQYDHPRPVVIIGSDIPDVTPAHINRAFRALGNHKLVFGPAVDGGFWLVGVNRGGTAPNNLFRSVRWSSRHTLSDTRHNITNIKTVLVDEMKDVDSGHDL